jgi:HPt (histidine-containing phosphotransfer) domain-containing protein
MTHWSCSLSKAVNMETALLAIEGADDKSEMVNAIFRAAHTIKGSSGLFSLDHVVAFTHVVESVLDKVRAGNPVACLSNPPWHRPRARPAKGDVLFCAASTTVTTKSNFFIYL